jgi:hypothetical protein
MTVAAEQLRRVARDVLVEFATRCQGRAGWVRRAVILRQRCGRWPIAGTGCRDLRAIRGIDLARGRRSSVRQVANTKPRIPVDMIASLRAVPERPVKDVADLYLSGAPHAERVTAIR